ncbi:MAG TPA: NADH-quinone oxidoreductase subunit A [bacterium]|nr:NADH-quinone oxidoreductase subunit A [bacterium]
MLLNDYGLVGVFLIAGVAFVLAAMLTAWIFRPHKPTPAKLAPYECGETVKGQGWLQFNVRYYLIALVFVVFDIEALFLIPWIYAFKDVGLLGYVEMMAFIAILFVGLAYAWKKGALEWQ